MKRSGSDFRLPTFVLLGLLAPSAFADTFVVYGTSGNVGSLIVAEALERGHEVIGVSRNPDSLELDHANFSAIQGDVTDPSSIVASVRGADAVIIAVGGVGAGNTPETAVAYRGALAYVEAASRLGAATPYVIQVGSGTSLLRDGVAVFDTLDIEPGTFVHGLFYGHQLALDTYRASSGFDWVVMSAADGSIMQEGVIMDRYRLGDQETLFDRNGSSLLHKNDYAIAVIDMAESQMVAQKRVAVGPMW
ncbi:MAG: NAD(P)H-binding protein [Gammaproteobacteria bacterium]|nr:NAD(P)H-binding protein [Gammaproteobacteria bacterium]